MNILGLKARLLGRQYRSENQGEGAGDHSYGEGPSDRSSHESDSAGFGPPMSAAPPTPVAPPSFADRNFNPDGTRTVEGEAAANEGLASLPTYTTGQAYDPASPAYDSSVNPTLWDKFKDAMPSWETVGNVASIAVPALRVPMTAYNMYKSISNDPSASNVLGSVLSAPISRLTGLTPGTIQSAIKGDFGGAIANQGIGALMGPAMQSVARNYGPDAARALGMANAGFGGTAAAQKSLAGAINNAVSGLGTSVQLYDRVSFYEKR